MSERQIFSKILRLDKYIYNELIVLDGALQRGDQQRTREAIKKGSNKIPL